jgi:arsenite oxidase small subunit
MSMSSRSNPHRGVPPSFHACPPSLSRRAFARTALVAPALLAACQDDSTTTEGSVATLAELESHEPVEFTLDDGTEAFVVKLHGPAQGGVGPEESIVAFSRLCPHMGCPIDVAEGVDAERGHFGPCGCHQSLFDIRRSGRMVHGRASTNLCRIELSVRDGAVWTTGAKQLDFGQPLTAEHAISLAPKPEDQG